MDNNDIRLQKVYTNLYNEIVQPDRVCVITQYFRTQWMPRLNPRLAWLIINLRQHCYWNKKTGELRDWCIVDQTELSRELGADKKTLRRLMKSEHADKFILEARTDRYRYDGSLGKQVRQKTRYRIRMDDPLTPEDEIFFKERLIQEMQGINIDPETGQMDWLKLFNRPLSEIDPAPKGQNALKVQQEKSKETNDQADKMSSRSNKEEAIHQQGTLSPRSNEAQSNQTDKMPPRSSTAIDSGEKDQADKMPLRSQTKGEKYPQYDNEDKMPSILYQGQNAPITTSTSKYNNKTDSVVVDLLTEFDVVEPALSQYQHYPVPQVDGWISYARSHNLGPGFVVQQLAADVWPPEPRGHSASGANQDMPLPVGTIPSTPTPSRPSAETLASLGLSPTDLDAWTATLETLKGQMTKDTYENWVKACRLQSQADGIYTIIAPNERALIWLENRLYDVIARAFGREVGKEAVVFRFIVQEV